MQIETFRYDNRIVKMFTYATLFWGLVGMAIGFLLASQIFAPSLNFLTKYITFGRLRPVHTNAAIFAFVGNGFFMGAYYSLQRLLKARMYSDLLSKINFWGWQLIILSAAITIPLGLTTSKEYAELEWPIDIAITVVWLIFGINMTGTMLRRRVKHLYVSIWFYISTFVTIAILHVVNSFEIPVTLFKSYSLYAGAQDALVQWWYGHNAVAFFLTTPYLGLMYYFVPKAANRPLFSYTLSIISFWSLIFAYIWVGPHHLLYTALPEWLQGLGTVFSIMLLAPSWGSTVNGLLTLKGTFHEFRIKPELKFLTVAIVAYGMATFEGPMLALKSVNAISHYTDWTIAHVHVGVLGWNGFLTFGIFYWLIPRLFDTKLFSRKLANLHFWLGLTGAVLYAVSMWYAGISSGVNRLAFNDDGFLKFGSFLETTLNIVPAYHARALGGALYLIGALIMLYNLIKTIKSGSFADETEVQAPPLDKHYLQEKTFWHRWIESRPIQFTIWAIIAIGIGTALELIPAFAIKSNVKTIENVQPYTPLELQGRDLYIREGCLACHSQMVRPFRAEYERYGEYSKAGEFVYDHPFLWGSKRTGPDLHRVGGKYPDAWHYNHMEDPESMSPGSIMPLYPWLLSDKLDTSATEAKIEALRKLGVPYPEGYSAKANEDLMKQAEEIAKSLQDAGITTTPDKEIIALIAYLQRLGTDIKAQEGD